MQKENKLSTASWGPYLSERQWGTVVKTIVKMEMHRTIFLMNMLDQELIAGEKTDWPEFPILNVSFALLPLFGMERTLIS